MASSTRWTWVWVNSGSWWWTGRPGVLQSMGSQSWTRRSDWSELNQGNIPSLTMQNFQILGFHTISKNHTPLILPPISSKKVWQMQVFQNSNFCLKTWILSLAMMTGSLCSISRRRSLNTYVWITIVFPSIVISSKNDPFSWVGSNTQEHFPQTAGLWLRAAMLQIHGYSKFHHLAYQRPLLEDWDLIKKKKQPKTRNTQFSVLHPGCS